jgi:hypothetical protein
LNPLPLVASASNLVLIYRKLDDAVLQLMRLGSHSKLGLCVRRIECSREISRVWAYNHSEQSMRINEFRRLAEKIDQHMQPLSARPSFDM